MKTDGATLRADQATGPVGEERTRSRVTRLLLEHGPASAAELGAELALSPAAIRRHLDAMLADGLVET
ncbi:MAG: helix-turn-helix domain-containing protein, partial [Natronosporangium sp.]